MEPSEALRAMRRVLGHGRLVAAVMCLLLGVVVLGAGLLARPAPAPAPTFDLEAALPLDPADALPLDAAPEGLADGASAAPVELVVYVTGAVLRPDVYRLAPGARVKDAVLAAGGLGPDAAAEQVNLAEPVSDAAHVHIPALAEVAPPQAAAPAGADPGLIDLNLAGEADLEELPGVGKTLAARIIARRAEVGPFTAVEELREVTGIGEKLYAQIAPLVTVGR